MMNDLALTVDQWLGKVEYNDEGAYTPSAFSLKFIAFIKLVNGGEGEENKSPVLHMKMLDPIGNIGGNTRFVRLANLVYRGAAKTTLMEYLFFYLGVYGKITNFGNVEYAIYVSDSIDNGVKAMRKNLESRYNNSVFLQKYIPKMHFTDIRWEFTNIEGNLFEVRAFGAKTGVRGTKAGGKRPKLAVLDDLVSDEDARSKTTIDSIRATVENAIEYALHPKKNIVIWSGTPFNTNDPLYRAIESGAWTVNVYPVCEKFPCTKEEFRGAWSDRHDYEYVLGQYTRAVQQGRPQAFYQELMLQIMSEEDRLIKDEDIRWYSLASLKKRMSDFNIYITTDFAVSEKASADFNCISVWAVNYIGQAFWIDGILKRQTMDKTIDDLFLLAQKYQPMGVAIETSGQQGAFLSWIETEMFRRNVYFSFATEMGKTTAGVKPTTDKISRFSMVLPLFSRQGVKFPIEHKNDFVLVEGIKQLKLITVSAIKAKNDDFIDTVSQLGAINLILPSARPKDKDESNIWGSKHSGNIVDNISSYIV